jgi:hypothetical protein
MKWTEQGCVVCREAWEAASPTRAMELLGTSYKLHCRLYQCRACGAYWEELERLAHELGKTEAERLLSDPSFKPVPTTQTSA